MPYKYPKWLYCQMSIMLRDIFLHSIKLWTSSLMPPIQQFPWVFLLVPMSVVVHSIWLRIPELRVLSSSTILSVSRPSRILSFFVSVGSVPTSWNVLSNNFKYFIIPPSYTLYIVSPLNLVRFKFLYHFN